MSNEALTSQDITAIVLAGGLGTRLRSALPDQPKSLAMVNDKPFLAYLLDQIYSIELKEVILCTGYLGDMVQRSMGVKYQGLLLSYSREETPLGTAGAIRLALPNIHTSYCLVFNGDSYCDTDLTSFQHWGMEHTAAIVLAYVEDASRYGSVTCDDESRIVRFEEKKQNSKPGLINAGIYLLPRTYIESIPTGKPVSLERQMFPLWINKGLYGYKTKSQFIDIGTPETYMAAETFFRRTGKS